MVVSATTLAATGRHCYAPIVRVVVAIRVTIEKNDETLSSCAEGWVVARVREGIWRVAAGGHRDDAAMSHRAAKKPSTVELSVPSRSRGLGVGESKSHRRRDSTANCFRWAAVCQYSFPKPSPSNESAELTTPAERNAEERQFLSSTA